MNIETDRLPSEANLPQRISPSSEFQLQTNVFQDVSQKIDTVFIIDNTLGRNLQMKLDYDLGRGSIDSIQLVHPNGVVDTHDFVNDGTNVFFVKYDTVLPVSSANSQQTW